MSGRASGHGGARPGAGRRKGDGCKWSEPTRVMRIPASRIEAVSAFLTHPRAVLRPADAPTVVPLPMFGHKVRAGFPSPADDYVEAARSQRTPDRAQGRHLLRAVRRATR